MTSVGHPFPPFGCLKSQTRGVWQGIRFNHSAGPYPNPPKQEVGSPTKPKLSSVGSPTQSKPKDPATARHHCTCPLPLRALVRQPELHQPQQRLCVRVQAWVKPHRGSWAVHVQIPANSHLERALFGSLGNHSWPEQFFFVTQVDVTMEGPGSL